MKFGMKRKANDSNHIVSYYDGMEISPLNGPVYKGDAWISSVSYKVKYIVVVDPNTV